MRVDRECVIKLKVWYSREDESKVENIADKCGLEFIDNGVELVAGSPAPWMSFETDSNEDADRFEDMLKRLK